MSGTSKDDLRSNIHRFRVRRASPAPESAQRRRSASPPVGPLPRDIPACDRCRTFKKKCSRTFPVCSLCANAGHDCSFSAPVSSGKAQTHHLRARVEWLSRLIDENLLPAGGPGIEGVGTGTDLTGMLASPPAIASVPAVGQLDLAAQAHSTGATPDSVNLEQGFESDTRLAAALRRLESVNGNLGGSPRDTLARTLVNAYFRHIHRAYPFMNRARVLRDLESLGSVVWPPRRADSTLLFLVMALGCTTLQRSGQMPRDAAALKFDVPSAEIVQECLLKDDLESIQILTLLALHCLYDPAATSTWSVSGIASRKALSYGLTRRASNDSSLSSTDKELRYRLFWSVWVLDRVMAYSTGLPPALCDEGVDVPLPGLAVEEFASPERQRFASVLQIHRHIIQLRQLEDRILTQILSRKHADVSLPPHARLALTKQVRTDIDNWYSDGCLLSPVEPDNVPIHTSVAWLSARYYHMLLTLHYPCHANGFGAAVSALDLLRFVQKHLQSTLVLLQQRQLPLNFVTLARTLPVGLLLVHCLMSGASETASTDEVDTLINVFEAFPDHWAHARRAAHVFRQVRMNIVEASAQQTLGFSDGRMQTGPAAWWQALQRSHAAAVTAVMEDVLGRTTCFAIPEFLARRSPGVGGLCASSSPMNPIQTSVASLHEEGTEPDWGSLQFAFL